MRGTDVVVKPDRVPGIGGVVVSQPDGPQAGVPASEVAAPGDPSTDSPAAGGPAADGPAAVDPAGDRFAELAAEQFLSLVTFRRDGTAVPTPVWVTSDDGRLLIWTGADSGKIKRLRHTSAVTVAPCEFGGSLLGEPVPAHARVMATDELGKVDTAMRAKYGWQFRLALVVATVARVLGIVRRGQIGLEVVLD